MRQREELLSRKQQLIARIQRQARQIESLRQQQAQLTISLDELGRESEQQQMRLQPGRTTESKRLSGGEWGAVDRVWGRVGGLGSEPLADALLLAARQEGSIKSVFRNYRTNERMGELVRQAEVRGQLAKLH